MSYKPGRHFLQIPGPTNVPDRILHAIANPTIDHRSPDFAALTATCLEGMKAVFQTKGDVAIFPASGTGAWEAALVNTLSRGRQGPGLRYRPLRQSSGLRWRATSASTWI